MVIEGENEIQFYCEDGKRLPVSVIVLDKSDVRSGFIKCRLPDGAEKKLATGDLWPTLDSANNALIMRCLSALTYYSDLLRKLGFSVAVGINKPDDRRKKK
jgi:hypothetical protein